MAHGTVKLFHLSLKSLDEAGDMDRIDVLNHRFALSADHQAHGSIFH